MIDPRVYTDFDLNKMPWQRKAMNDWSPILLLTGNVGGGKALRLDTEVVTPTGFRPLADIAVGDVVYGEDGLPVRVKTVSEVYTDHACYKVSFEGGESVVADAEHQWVLAQGAYIPDMGYRRGVYTTEQVANALSPENKLYVPLCGPVRFTGKAPAVSTVELAHLAWLAYVDGDKKSKVAFPDHKLPDELLFAPVTERENFLQVFAKNMQGYKVELLDPLFASSLHWLISSLGLCCSLKVKRDKKGRAISTIRLIDSKLRRILSIRPCPSVPVKCIEVDSQWGSFLITRSFIPTHNSRLSYEKIDMACRVYPGTQALVMRKDLEDTKKSILPTLRDHVLKINPRTKKGIGGVYESKADSNFIYPHPSDDPARQSRIWWAGMHGESQRESLRSVGSAGMIDIALMEEGVEFEEEDLDELLGRMRGTHVPHPQIIIPTNPGPSLHWINRRLIIAGEASVHYSYGQQNPYNPESYFAMTARMRGTRKARLVDGLWIDGTGLVIDAWLNAYNHRSAADGGGNVTLDADYIPSGGKVVLGADDGYVGEWDPISQMFTAGSHPRALALFQLRRDGRIAVFAESYQVMSFAEAHLRDFRSEVKAKGWPWPNTAHYDKASATLGGALRLAGMSHLYKSPSNALEAIKKLNELVAPDLNGFRRLIIHPRCVNMILEFGSWSLDKRGEPRKEFDHGVDCAKMVCWNVTMGPAKRASIAVDSGGDAAIEQMVQERMDEIEAILAAHGYDN